jgi:Ni,Fe-hydrogenase III large subunit
MNERTKLLIKIEADRIKSKLRNAKLCGEEIDFDNLDMMIVATYSFSWHEAYNDRLSEMEILNRFEADE